MTVMTKASKANARSRVASKRRSSNFCFISLMVFGAGAFVYIFAAGGGTIIAAPISSSGSVTELRSSSGIGGNESKLKETPAVQEPPLLQQIEEAVDEVLDEVTSEITDKYHEDYHGAPVGEGEYTVDSYHSFDHRPPDLSDPRDALLNQYTMHPCPNHGKGTMVSGQDSRHHENNGEIGNFQERNPKFLCSAHEIADRARAENRKCIVYSFGSFDEISFEIGMNRVTNSECHIHTFDPAKPPSERTARRNHVVPHKWGLAAENSIGKNNREAKITGGPPEYKTLSTIMTQLNHTYLDVLKIDIEGAERSSVPEMVDTGAVKLAHQILIEFHSVALMNEGLDRLQEAGFRLVYARREDRCAECTEVAMVQMRDDESE